jgi:hypothetical protein
MNSPKVLVLTSQHLVLLLNATNLSDLVRLLKQLRDAKDLPTQFQPQVHVVLDLVHRNAKSPQHLGQLQRLRQS